MIGQDRLVPEREKETERKSKELEKEVARLQTLVAELVEELKEMKELMGKKNLKELKEMNKTKTDNFKTMAEHENAKSKDTINNLKEVNVLQRDEKGRIEKALKGGKITIMGNVKHQLKDELENMKPILCLQNDRMKIQIKELMEAEEEKNPHIAKFQMLKSELETYKLLESVFYSTPQRPAEKVQHRY